MAVYLQLLVQRQQVHVTQRANLILEGSLHYPCVVGIEVSALTVAAEGHSSH